MDVLPLEKEVAVEREVFGGGEGARDELRKKSRSGREAGGEEIKVWKSMERFGMKFVYKEESEEFDVKWLVRVLKLKKKIEQSIYKLPLIRIRIKGKKIGRLKIRKILLFNNLVTF